jgi:hypothetical protein
VARGNLPLEGGDLLVALVARGSSVGVGTGSRLRGGRHRAPVAQMLTAGSSHVDADVEKHASSAPYLARQNVGGDLF